MSKETIQQMIKVAEVYLVKDGDSFVGMELGWSESVLNEEGAAGVLDAMRANLNSAAWTTAMVRRAGGEKTDDTGASADRDADGDDGNGR